MPQPPADLLPASVASEVRSMRQDLLQDVKRALKIANEEVLEQHRVLIDQQQSCLQEMMNRFGAQSNDTDQTIQQSKKPPELWNEQVAQSNGGPCDAFAENGANTEPSPITAKTPENTVANRGQTWITDNTPTKRGEFHSPSLFLEKGFAVSLVNGAPYSALSICMIVANAIYIGVEADWNAANATSMEKLPFVVCDQVFCIFFVSELILCLFTFKNKWECYKDRWFVLDAFIAGLMVTETWILAAMQNNGAISGVGRMLRLLRLMRISRLGKIIPELVTMVRGMVAAMRAVHAVLIILMLLVYVFAIIMNSIMGTLSPLFNSVRTSMVTLLVQGVLLDDISSLTYELIEIGNPASLLLFGVFVLLSALTVMNMLIGLLCQVVLDVSAEQRENNVKAQMKTVLLVMLQDLDEDNSGELSKTELQSVLTHPEAIAEMMDIGVDTQHLLDLTEMLYVSEDATIPISVIMNIVLSLRGSRPVTMNDIAKANNFLMWSLEAQMSPHTLQASKMDELLASMKDHQQTISNHQQAIMAHSHKMQATAILEHLTEAPQ